VWGFLVFFFGVGVLFCGFVFFGGFLFGCGFGLFFFFFGLLVSPLALRSGLRRDNPADCFP